MHLEKQILKLSVLICLILSGGTEIHAQKNTIVDSYRRGKQFQNQLQNDSAILEFKTVVDADYNELPDSIKKILPSLAIKVTEYFVSKNDVKNGAPFAIKTIDICKSSHDTTGLIRAYNLNAEIQRSINNFSLAKTEVRKAIFLATISGMRDKRLYDNLILLAGIFLDERIPTDSAAYYLSEALPLIKSAKDTARLSKCYNNLAVSFQRKQENEKAEFYYKKVLELQSKIGNEFGIIKASCNIAQILCDEKKYKEALDVSFQTLKNYKIDNEKILSDFYLSIARSYLHLNSPDSAERYFEKFFEGTFSAFDKQQNEYINELNTKYRTEEQEKDIALLTSKTQLQEVEARRKQIIIYAFIAITLFLVFSVYLSVKSYRNKQKANLLITEQKNEVERQKHLVEEKQKEIIDSINYAKRIQYTILANDGLIRSAFPEHFTLFLPKDIVSGDFYWATSVNSNYGDEDSNKISENDSTKSHRNNSKNIARSHFYLAVCDSTGHGVPGAFMSLLNSSYLNEAINEKFINDPGKILDHVRTRLKQNVSKEGHSDGMDCILIAYDALNNSLTYAAANNKPVLISNGELIEYTADKMPVGDGIKNDEFQTRTFNFKKGEMLYLYTDGYADQFGGPKGKKFKYKQLNELLRSLSQEKLENQKKILEEEFTKWKGGLEQVDDVCIIGIRF